MPLRRRTPLKAKTPLARKGRLKAIGARKKRLSSYHNTEREAVLLRCYGKCEACGAPFEEQLEYLRFTWAHLFGRGNKGIGEPWASWRWATAGLHQSCHNAMDSEAYPEAQERLRWRAVYRLAGEFAVRDLTLPEFETTEDPLDVARRMVLALEAYATKNPDTGPTR